MPPRRVGPYDILSVIGRGGIGTVYRARHAASGQLAAVKVLGPAPAVEATAARRLAREYDVLRALDHPNVVRVYDAGVFEGYSFLAMELIEGLDLRAYLSPALDEVPDVQPADLLFVDSAESDVRREAEHGSAAILALAALWDEPETEPRGYDVATYREPEASGAPAPREELPEEARAALNRPARIARLRGALSQVLDALSYVHGLGLVHRDLKPSNVMVDQRRVARLMDFGLVKSASESDEPLTHTGRVVGTYRYMSPEQAQGHPVDARSDLYSVGVILYELLAGTPPFLAADPGGMWREILTAAPRPILEANPGADAALARLSERLLEKAPARRPQSAAEVKAALGG